MPDPVTPSELLLQQVVDKLDTVIDLLGRDARQPAKRQTKKASTGSGDTTQVDGR